MDLTAAADLARGLMNEHGLAAWGFAFDRARVRAGACHFADRRITLSRALTAAHDEVQVRETVLHEIAHALVGPRHGHDGVWRAKAREIGSTGDRCYAGGEDPVVPGRWQGRCAAGHVVHRHRRPTRVLLWTLDGSPVGFEQLGPQVRRDLAHLRSREP